MEPLKGSAEPFAEREWNGELARELPSTQLARLTHNYWSAAASCVNQAKMHDYAMDVLEYAAVLAADAIPGGDWEAVYDTWLARASHHACNRRNGG
jgi:hypothetical protein